MKSLSAPAVRVLSPTMSALARQPHLLGCMLVVGVLTGTNATPATADVSRPNVILILTDDQAWSGTSLRMDPDDPQSASDFYQTPNLEALAAQGMRFTDAYAAASVCSPTRAALQTGRSPSS